jgi:V-type H+-transporting ATPase subunit E
MAGPLTGEDVQKQLKQMCSFILKEANEKAHEIGLKAEEEFNIEKQRLIQEEKVKIRKDYEKKEKQVEVQKKIAYSNELNQARLKVLKSREEAMNRTLTEAFKRLYKIANSPNYKNILVDLIVQALLKIDEPKVFVICREIDHSLAGSVVGEAKSKYEKIAGRTVELSVDPVNRLSPAPVEGSSAPSCSGGIMLSTAEGKIICSNTLEQRLSMVYEQQLPRIRTMMFGASEGRKHFT